MCTVLDSKHMYNLSIGEVILNVALSIKMYSYTFYILSLHVCTMGEFLKLSLCCEVL